MDFKKFVYYDESSPSCLRWNKTIWSRATKNGVAGTLSESSGYWKVKIEGKIYSAHRIIWSLFNENLPTHIDHIDGNRNNNKITNLRQANIYENAQNAKKRIDNSSGIKGVSWYPRLQKWRVRISNNGHKMNLGYYEDLELAELVITEARNKFHKEYANHGS